MSEIIALKNRQSGMVLDHYAGKRIEAFISRTNYRTRQWRRITQPNGYSVFKNVGTGFLLGQYPEEPLRCRDTDVTNANCQWLELPKDDSGFVTLINRATGCALDHYREQSIQAYTDQVTTLSQQWQFVPLSFKRTPTKAVGDLEKYEKIAFLNRATGNALDHYAGERIEAYTDNVTNENHQWYRIPMGDGFFAFKNVYTGKVLEHYCGESVQAFSTITHLASHQWKEVHVADGYIALVNCASGKALHHCHKMSIQACHEDIHNEPTAQWKMQWISPRPF